MNDCHDFGNFLSQIRVESLTVRRRGDGELFTSAMERERVHSPERPTHAPITTVMYATVPLLLAALMIWMMRTATTHRTDTRSTGAATFPTSAGTL